MSQLASIQSFLEPREMAISGVSRNPKKFGRMVYDQLKEKGFKIYPVNPNTEMIDGETCYSDVSSLPEHVERLYIVTPARETTGVVEAAVANGIKNIWIQQKSENPEVVQIAEQNQVNLIHKECIFKYAEPVGGVHAFHRLLNKLFGSYPK